MTLKGWGQQIMMSVLTKEASYGAAVVVNASNFQGFAGHSDYDPDWADEVETDKDQVSGAEHGTTREVIAQGYKFSIAQPKARPQLVAAMIAGALGSDTPTQDGAFAAYRHKIVPVAAGTALPSFNVIGKKGDLQYLHKGNMVNSFEISGEAGKATSFAAEIMGSGHRAVNADSFIAAASESSILSKNGYIWIETSAAKSVDANATQGLENISSGTPRDLKAIIKKYSLKWNNNLEGQPGFGAGNGGVLQDLDYARRKAELSLDLVHVDETDLNYYLNDTILTLEVEVKGALIAAGGAMYYGYDIIIPRFMLTKAPLPKGGVNDTLSLAYEADIQDDGTLPAIIVNVYNSIPAYYA